MLNIQELVLILGAPCALVLNVLTRAVLSSNSQPTGSCLTSRFRLLPDEHREVRAIDPELGAKAAEILSRDSPFAHPGNY